MHTIAAIIPLYNGANYIEAALRSVLDQQRPADEIIVVDDGSTDNGPSLVQALAAANSKIRLLHKENGGQGSACNFGTRNCSSDLIALLDQDDYCTMITCANSSVRFSTTARSVSPIATPTSIASTATG